jgi:hypothetical protein
LTPSDWDSDWEPGFEGDRRVVVARLGPYQRVFRQPRNYRGRFFHRVYDLPVTDWHVHFETELLSGFCTAQTTLSIRFQATVSYIERNADALSDISAHVRSRYEGLVRDAVEHPLRRAEDSGFLQRGLEPIEKDIEIAIQELLTEQGVQCRCRAGIVPLFKEPSSEEQDGSDTHFQHQAIYMEMMNRRFEFEEQRRQVLYRQREDEERARLEHEARLQEQQRSKEDLQRLKDRQAIEQVKAELAGEESRQRERLLSEERLLMERIEHQKRQRRIELAAEQEKRSEEQLQIQERIRREEEIQEIEREAARKDQEQRLHTALEAEDCLHKEIELLVLERQRNELEVEARLFRSGKRWQLPAGIRGLLGRGDSGEEEGE